MKTKEAIDPNTVHREQLSDLGILLRSAAPSRGFPLKRWLARP
jgi:hypothetical protein